MRRFLVKGIDIQYSHRLSHITEDGDTITAHFENGVSITGHLLIGCDGGKSRVREFIVGKDAARGFDTDYTMINAWTTVPAATALALRDIHPVSSLAVHPDIRASTLIGLLDKPEVDTPPEEWTFQIYTGWKGAPRKADLIDPKDAMKAFKAVFEVFIDPFHTAALSIPDDVVLPVDDGWNFKPVGDFQWNNHNGKVTLAGDAAHSMLPHRGQGLNNAIMDAAEVVEAVIKIVRGELGLKQAIQAYEDEMRPRGAAEVDLSFQTMMAAHENDMNKSPLSSLGFKRPDRVS